MKSVIVREIIALVLRPVAPTASTAPPPPSTTGLPVSTGKHIRFTDDDPKPAPAPKPKKKPATSAEKKPGNAHARYYATITFNQIVLTPADREVALKLIDVYFEIFKELLGEDVDKVEVEEDKGSEEKREVKVDKGGRIIEGKAMGKGRGKTRTIEVKGAAGFAEVEDAHSRLISAILTGVNRALPFAKIDASDVGINKHIDTLFLITHTSTFNISLQALVLIQQISASISSSTTASSPTSSATAKSITDRYYRTLYVSLHDPRLATSSKQAMYLNLLFKSIKADVGNEDGERVKAIIRRFVQLLVSGGSGATEFVAGGLFLLGELFGSIPGLRAMLNKPAKASVEPYDPRKRDPQYAHASSSPLWELTPLLYHYHPAVSLHARQLLTSQPLTASADLSQNTLSHFLDRFVYKNPKKLKPSEGAPSAKSKGASAMQPAASSNVGVKLMKGEVEDADMMNEAAFLRRKEGDVPVDQLFFHKYFSRKSEREKARAGKMGKRNTDEGLDQDEDEEDEREEEEEFVGVGGSDEEAARAEAENEEEDSDLEEAEIWKAMKASIPKSMEDDADLLDSDDEENDDDDDLPSDFDMQMNDDESMEEDESSDEDKEEEVDEDDTLSLVEGSDNEDLISLDGDIPGGLIAYDGSDAEDGIADEEWGGINEDGLDGKKRKREETKGEKRKKLRSLPTFASYEDYAKLIENGPEDDI
ncbi:CBF/Mak21 family-domain-containing protein [Crucibulum laeve]|uniref:CBF/Mak21 family-domain-containing protein n=1 Tax=Crucibulum laeve TaxID=68775 RepID=A0A5C3LRL6_9AGAR|nr:CBF/Mak21 family-domain-containing protein [Crucibulum laeve]